MRRTALLPFFSTAYTRKLQPDIQERLGVMLTRMKGFKDTEEPINASCMYAAFTNGKQYLTLPCDMQRCANLFPDIMQILAFGECAYKLGESLLQHMPCNTATDIIFYRDTWL
jgi:hypothetical protein